MIRVTCAIIRNDENEVLVVQRGKKTDPPFKWEFPGGKIKDGESEEECIIREIREELSMDIVICGKLPEVKHDYINKQIVLIPFICDTLDDLPLLAEHNAFKWISPADLKDLDFSEADVFVANDYFESLSIQPHESEVSDSTDLPFNVDEELKTMINGIMSMKEVEWVATSAIENPAIFRKLLDYSYSEDKRLAFRSSWTLSKVCDKYPELIYPYLAGMVENVDKLDNESTQRSFLRIISMSDMGRLTNKHHGILAEHCFNALRSGYSAIAIKAYSMEVLYKLAVIYPELAYELSATVNMLQGEGSAGVVARGHLILKKLAEITSGNQQKPGRS
jgi:8-oxo-dGTP diphosphatase